MQFGVIPDCQFINDSHFDLYFNDSPMIPKIIHLCWLSGDKYPESIQRCLDSWKTHLPDYEIYLWDTHRFDVNSQPWTKEAFESKKYAFAADYIRLYALYHHGGIYLDSDVLVYKSFDDLLDLPYFIGEDYTRCFEAAVMGAEKGCKWIKQILDRYDNRPFIMADGTYDTRTLPSVFHDQLTPTYKFNLMKSKDSFIDDEMVINVFPYDHFNSRDFVDIKQFPNSYCSHNFVGSWLKKENSARSKVKDLLPRNILNLYDILIYKVLGFGKFHKIKIPYMSRRAIRNYK